MLSARNLLWFIPLLALMTVQLWYPVVTAFLTPPHDFATEVVNEEILQSMDMENVVLSQFTGEEQQWQIKAQNLHSKDGDSDLRLEKIEALFLGGQEVEGGRLSATNIQSDKAWYEKGSKQLILEDNVVVTTESGYEMKAVRLQFFERKHELLADSEVRISGRNFFLQGETMSYHIDTRHLIVTGNVVATLY
jgi:LPS export ABC transporter protein LptC